MSRTDHQLCGERPFSLSFPPISRITGTFNDLGPLPKLKERLHTRDSVRWIGEVLLVLSNIWHLKQWPQRLALLNIHSTSPCARVWRVSTLSKPRDLLKLQKTKHKSASESKKNIFLYVQLYLLLALAFIPTFHPTKRRTETQSLQAHLNPCPHQLG